MAWPDLTGENRYRHQSALQAQAAQERNAELEHALDVQRRISDTEKVAQQAGLIRAFKSTAIANGTPPEQADAIAAQQYAQYIASKPQEESATNQATTALRTNEMLRAQGGKPFMGKIGEYEAQATGEGAKTQGSSAMLDFARNMARMSTAPQAAVAGDLANIAGSNLSTAISTATSPGITSLIPAQQEAELAQARQHQTGANFNTQMTLAQDPTLQGQAANAQAKGQVAEGNLVSSAPLLGRGVNLPQGIPGMNIMTDPNVAKMISTAISNIVNRVPPAPGGTNALPNRRVKGNLNQLQ